MVCGLQLQVPAREWQYEDYGNAMRVLPADELSQCHMSESVMSREPRVSVQIIQTWSPSLGKSQLECENAFSIA